MACRFKRTGHWKEYCKLKGRAVTAGWGKLHIEELHDVYPLQISTKKHRIKQIQWFYVANHIQHLLCSCGYMIACNSWKDMQCIHSTKKLKFFFFRKLSPCSGRWILSCGWFPGVWILYFDVSEHSVCSIFICGVSRKNNRDPTNKS